MDSTTRKSCSPLSSLSYWLSSLRNVLKLGIDLGFLERLEWCLAQIYPRSRDCVTHENCSYTRTLLIFQHIAFENLHLWTWLNWFFWFALAMFAPPAAEGPSAPPASMFDSVPGYEGTVAGGGGTVCCLFSFVALSHMGIDTTLHS